MRLPGSLFTVLVPPKNHPLVHPKIDLPGREKNKPLSLFIAAILQHSLLYSTFSFLIQWPLRLSLPPSLFCLCSIQQSHLSLINQAFFLFSRSFSRLERWLGKAWEWDTCLGSRGKKRSRTRRISLKFIWLCFIFFCSFSLGHLDESGWDENIYYSNSTKTNAFCLGIILCNVSRSFDYLIYPYYPAYTS